MRRRRFRARFFCAIAAVVQISVLGSCASKIDMTAASGEAETPTHLRAVVGDLDRIIREEMSRNRIPGLAIGLVTTEGLLWGAGYGVASRDTDVPVTVTTRFPIASVTKPITAVATLRLAESGRLDLDRPIADYLPCAELPRLGDAPVPTVRDVLCHHGGFVRDVHKGIAGPTAGDVDLQFELSRILPANEAAGPYRYSNVGYALLGEIIGEVAGSTFDEFIEKDVFEPLLMENSTVGVDGDPETAQGYKRVGLLFPRSTAVSTEPRRDRAAGSIVSTVADLSRFVQMLLRGGLGPSHESYVRPETVASLFDPPYPQGPLDEDDYALGFKIGKLEPWVTDARHGGTLDGFSTLIVLVPEEGVGVVVLYNANQPFSRHYIANEALRLWIGEDWDDGSPKIRSSANIATVETAEPSGDYVGVGDFSLCLSVDVDNEKIELSGQRLELARERDGGSASRFRVVKKVLGIPISVAGAFGAEHAFLDFVTIDGEILPRIVLWYRTLPLEMYFRPLEGLSRPTEPVVELLGAYHICEESTAFAPPGLSAITVSEHENRLYVDLSAGGISKMVLNEVETTDFADTGPDGVGKDVGERTFRAVGTGETFRFAERRLFYSGLWFERRD